MVRRSPLILIYRAWCRSRLLQIGLVGIFWAAGEAIVQMTGCPLPGSIVGLSLALLALCAGRLRVATMKRGADLLLAEMLLFFVPAVLALMDHRELLGLLGLKILAIIILSTVTVMCVTALTVDLCYRWSNGRDGTNPVA